MARRRRNRGLGLSAADHLTQAKRLVNDAWNDLERLPPTCEGGINIAARALASVTEAGTHLASIEDRNTREANHELYGDKNRAGAAAWKAIQFYARTCKAPHAKASKRPLSRRIR